MLEYERLPIESVGVIPELRIPLESERRWWSGEPIPPHVFFGDVFSGFLVSELGRDSRPELLKRLFAFVEELANHPDIRVQELVQQSVLANLCDGNVSGKQLKNLLGRRSNELMREYCGAWHKH